MHYSLRCRRPAAQFYTDDNGCRRLNISARGRARRRQYPFDRRRDARSRLHQKRIRHAHLGMQAAIFWFRSEVGDLINYPF